MSTVEYARERLDSIQVQWLPPVRLEGTNYTLSLTIYTHILGTIWDTKDRFS